MDATEIVLRLAGAFYAFAGYAATRAALTSYLLDRAIAAIGAKRPTLAETAQAVWMLVAATAILAGGVLLILLADIAAWLFLASALLQAVYIYYVAPRFFDVDDPPEAQGRRQTTNAFVLYAAATAFVLWAQHQGKLVGWRDIPWPLLAGAAAVVVANGCYALWMFTRPLGGPSSAAALSAEPSRDPASSQRVKVMAYPGFHPLWAMDDDCYGEIDPEALGLSYELKRDLAAWSAEYQPPLDTDDTSSAGWGDEQRRAHDAAGRVLAVRLARERPDLTVYAMEHETGVVEVNADEPI